MLRHRGGSLSVIYEVAVEPSVSQDQGWIIKSSRSNIRIKQRGSVVSRSAKRHRCWYARVALSISLVVVPRFNISNDQRM